MINRLQSGQTIKQKKNLEDVLHEQTTVKFMLIDNLFKETRRSSSIK